jgi:hypothetical protein
MTWHLKATGLAGLLAAGLWTAPLDAARADDAVGETRPVVTELGDHASAITYWVNAPDGWHVVTTVDTVLGQGTVSETHAIVRFSSVLLPGQSQQVSIPVALGARQPVLVVRRLGDRIEVARVAGSV